MGQFISVSIIVFLIAILLLVVILLIAKKYLSPSGNVTITINSDKTLTVAQGDSLMSTLNQKGIFLPSACGGKASCGQCKVQVLAGGGEILESEIPHFTRRQVREHWRLGVPDESQGQPVHPHSPEHSRGQVIRLYSDLESECQQFYQGAEGSPSEGTAYRLYAGFIYTDLYPGV
jgi:Na+-transporting NADH:ubiquinone oxidoreductase subunit F